MKLLETSEPPDGAPSPAARAAGLMAEAKAAAFEHTRLVDDALRDVVTRAKEVSDAGDPYPYSVRDLCARIAEDIEQRRQLLETLVARGLSPAGSPRFGMDGV